MLAHTVTIALHNTHWASLTICYEERSDDTAKFNLSKWLSVILNTDWSPLSAICSRTHPIAIDGTLPPWLTVCSEVISQDPFKYTCKYTPQYMSEQILKYNPKHALQYTPSCTPWYTPSLLECIIPNKLSRHSEAHSWVWFEVHFQSYLTIWSHMCSWLLNPETCSGAGARHRVGGWKVANGSQHYDIDRY